MDEPRYCPFADKGCLQNKCEFFSDESWTCLVKSFYSYISELGTNVERFEKAVDKLEKLSTTLNP